MQHTAGRRLSLITFDQVLSGASNVLVALLSAHLLGVAAFGFFGLVLIVYAAAQGITRSLIGDPVLVHPEDARENPGAPIAAALLIGAGMGALVLAAALVCHLFDLPLAPELLALGLAFPGLVLHDLGRYLSFALQRPIYAVQLDLLWTGLIAVLMTLMVVRDAASLTWFVAAWVGTGAAASTLVFIQHGPPTRGGFAWLRTRWHYSWRFLLSFTAMQGAALAFSVVVAAIAGARALGAIRGALLLIRPYILFQTAAVAAGVSEIANAPTHPASERHVRRTTVIALAIGIVNIAILMLIPDVVGRLLLASAWDAAQPLLAPAGLQILALGLIVGPRSYLTGRKAIRWTVALDLSMTVVVLATGSVGVVMGGAIGAFWGTAIGHLIGAVMWWTALRLWRRRNVAA